MPKNSFTTPVKVGHWDASALNPFEITPNMAQIILEAVPANPATLSLVLPSEASDGDWYEWSDPEGLVSANFPLHLTAADGRHINGAATFASTTANASGKAVYDGSINQWALIGAK